MATQRDARQTLSSCAEELYEVYENLAEAHQKHGNQLIVSARAELESCLRAIKHASETLAILAEDDDSYAEPEKSDA